MTKYAKAACPHCHSELEPHDPSFDYGDSHAGPSGTNVAKPVLACPECEYEEQDPYATTGHRWLDRRN